MSVDRLEVSRSIRFGLHDLSARNGHHAFEELCRFLVAERIVSNVYPATGPVAAGGDGGRDFQSFETHLDGALGPSSGFAALASGEPVAFICTLQTGGLPTKIRRDLRKIAAGPSVRKVYALVSADVTASKAEELKLETREKYDISLEILDGQAIAELLAHHETFWIAARWLALPAEMAPDSPDQDQPEWYVTSVARWRDRDDGILTMGELMEVRAGLRRATFHRQARADIGLWLARMSAACTAEIPPAQRQRARYETAVGQLRGVGDLRPADGHVVAFFQELDASSDPWALMMDASVLLQYVVGAAVRGRTTISRNWIVECNARLRNAVSDRLRDRTLTSGQRAGLFDVLGHLRAHPDLTGVELPTEPQDRWEPLDHGHGDEFTYESAPTSLVLVDADGAIDAWRKVTRLAAKAPLVPIESLSQIVGLLAPVLVDRAGYHGLVEALDALVSEASGASAAAERSRDRALALLRQDRPLAALADLHDAKVRWWHGDTIRGSLLALLLLARIYRHLGLPLAARQQALVATVVAHSQDPDEHGDLVASGLMFAAHCDYGSGAWCSAVETYAAAMLAHAHLEEDPWNVERHEDLRAVDLHSGYLRASAILVSPALDAAVRELQRETGLDEVLQEIEELIETRTAEEWRDLVYEQLGVTPWNDVGPDRIIRWSALGIAWEVSAVNRYAHCRAAERFAAAAQVLCAELATEDLVLLPTRIRVRVQASGSAGKGPIRSKPGNDGSDWLVDLMPVPVNGREADFDAVNIELLAALTTVFFEASMAPRSAHEEVIKRCFARGLTHKIAAGQPYDNVASVVPPDRFAATGRESLVPPTEWRPSRTPAPGAALERRIDPGPGYSRDKALSFIRNRYARAREILTFTLPRLAIDPQFQQTYAELRNQGWRDWHLLLALVNARINFRNEGANLSLKDVQANLREQHQHASESSEEPPLPASWLTVERLSEMRKMAFLTGAPLWDLELHQETPDIDALVLLLEERYGYRNDDVPHDPIFGEPATSAAATSDA